MVRLEPDEVCSAHSEWNEADVKFSAQGHVMITDILYISSLFLERPWTTGAMGASCSLDSFVNTQLHDIQIYQSRIKECRA